MFWFFVQLRTFILVIMMACFAMLTALFTIHMIIHELSTSIWKQQMVRSKATLESTFLLLRLPWLPGRRRAAIHWWRPTVNWRILKTRGEWFQIERGCVNDLKSPFNRSKKQRRKNLLKTQSTTCSTPSTVRRTLSVGVLSRAATPDLIRSNISKNQ